MLLRIGRTVSPIRVVTVKPNIHQDHNEMYGCTSAVAYPSDILVQILNGDMEGVMDGRSDWQEAAEVK